MVYLWVDGSDPEWQTRRSAFTGQKLDNTEANCKGRYSDNGELRYNLRAVEKYAPWIRRIFIVTDDQTPDWLDTSNPRVVMVRHRDILPEISQPCFNSSLIEHFLYKIPELSEHFLYANDDTFINKPVTPEMFFAPDGLPIVRLIRTRLRDWYLTFRKNVLGVPYKYYIRTLRNSAELVEKKYGVYYSGKPHHNIDAYLKSSCRHTGEVFGQEISEVLTNHIRRDNDIQRVIYSYTLLAEKRGHLQYVTQRTSFRFHIQKKSHYAKLRRYDPLFFCMNDSEYAADSDRKRVTEFLAGRFPDKSRFEKQPGNTPC